MRITRKFIFTLSCLLLAPGLFAQNIGFLRKGPVAYLSDAEIQMLKDSIKEALENPVDGETVQWSNAESGHSGNITTLDTDEDYDTICRTVRIHTKAGGRAGSGIFRLCKAEDGSWRFAPTTTDKP